MSDEIASLLSDFSGLEYTEWVDSDVCKPKLYGIYEVTYHPDRRIAAAPSLGPEFSSGTYSYWGEFDKVSSRPCWGRWKITPEVDRTPGLNQRPMWRGLTVPPALALHRVIRGGNWRISPVTHYGPELPWEAYKGGLNEDLVPFKNLQAACEWLINVKQVRKADVLHALKLRNAAAKTSRSF